MRPPCYECFLLICVIVSGSRSAPADNPSTDSSAIIHPAQTSAESLVAEVETTLRSLTESRYAGDSVPVPRTPGTPNGIESHEQGRPPQMFWVPQTPQATQTDQDGQFSEHSGHIQLTQMPQGLIETSPIQAPGAVPSPGHVCPICHCHVRTATSPDTSSQSWVKTPLTAAMLNGEAASMAQSDGGDNSPLTSSENTFTTQAGSSTNDASSVKDQKKSKWPLPSREELCIHLCENLLGSAGFVFLEKPASWLVALAIRRWRIIKIKTQDMKLDEITETLNELKLRQKEIKETQGEHDRTLNDLKPRLENIDTIKKTQHEHDRTLNELKLKPRLKAIDTIKKTQGEHDRTLNRLKPRLEKIDTIKKTQGDHGRTLNELKSRLKEIDTINETLGEHGRTLSELKSRLKEVDTIKETLGEQGGTLNELKPRLKEIDTIKETLDGIKSRLDEIDAIKSRLEDIDTVKETQGKLLRQNNEIIDLLRQLQAHDTEPSPGDSPPGSHGTQCPDAGDNADSSSPRPTTASDAQSGPIRSVHPVSVDENADAIN